MKKYMSGKLDLSNYKFSDLVFFYQQLYHDEEIQQTIKNEDENIFAQIKI
jgi:hypothetical protein